MNNFQQSQNNNKKIRLIMALRRAGIRCAKTLGAMEKVPRDAFVPDAVRHQAWEDMALPIGRGQTISQPYVVALMSEALELTGNEKVLEIGTGCGYQTAILSRLARRVYSIERHEPLLERAEQTLAGLHVRNVTAIAADGMKGWPVINRISQAPFDKIIVTAAAREKPPQALLDQLHIGGTLVIPVGGSGEQVLRRYDKESDDIFAMTDLAPVRFVPLLPDVAEKDEAQESGRIPA